MSYGAPAFRPWQRSYELDVTHDETGIGLIVTRGSGGDEAAVDAVVQAFLDLVDGSPDFSVTGSKVVPSGQAITPT